MTAESVTTAATREQVVLSLLAPPDVDDPHVAFQSLRAGGPVVHSPGLDTFFVIGGDECRKVLCSKDFPVIDAAWMDEHDAGWQTSSGDILRYSLLPFINPPVHTRLRKLTARDLTVRKIEAIRPIVDRETDLALDALAEQGRNGTPVDFLDVVAYPVTTAVMAALLGIPRRDRPAFRQWSDDLLPMQDPAPTPEAKAGADAAADHFRAYLEGLIAQRRRQAQDDLVSAYVAVHENDPDQLTDDEVYGSVLLLVLAGYVTTSDELGLGLHALLTHRAHFERLCQDPSSVESVVEEILRFIPTVQVVQRYAAKDVRMGDTTITAGSRVLVMLGAANRDPATCPVPDDFDPTRRRGEALAFGAGHHYCLGRVLAMVELTTVLGRFAARFPNARFANSPVRRKTLGMAGFQTLELILGD